MSKAKYKAITGREQKKDADILCYQIRQAFVPGEVTPEEANKIGYETAMRWTKGKHAFFVATHVDREHTHNHIYYNSTSLDCTRKFRNFWNSTFAVRRLSDRVCLENGLSYIEKPKLHSKGKHKHYGNWLGDNKPLTFQEKLKLQIDTSLAKKPKNINTFLELMLDAGFEHKYGRGGVLSFRNPAEGQERFTRLRSSTLGKGYALEEIISIIKGDSPLAKERATAGKVSLIVDIQSKMQAGKGVAYERWAKVFNLKQMAATLQYLQESNLADYSQLEELAAKSTDRFHSLSDEIKSIEVALTLNSELKSATIDYAKTQPVFNGYKTARYSKKYLAEHEADIQLHQAARATFSRLLAGSKLPSMETLKAEYQKLTSKKKSAYKEYRKVKEEMREAVTAKANIDHLFALTDDSKNKEMER